MGGRSSLLDDIQRDALDATVPLASTLRKVVALGGEVGSSELREWASRELRGYQGIDEVPEYRQVAAPIQIDAVKATMHIKGQQISPRALPDFVQEKVSEVVPLANGVGELESMAARAQTEGSIQLGLPMSQDVASLMNNKIGDPFQQITRIYWSVSSVAIDGVIDQVRTTLVELIAEIRAGTPASAEAPSASVADQAVNVVVRGIGSRVNVNTAQASGSGAHDVQIGHPPDELDEPWWKGFWTWLVGVATVVGTLVGIAVWQGWSI